MENNFKFSMQELEAMAMADPSWEEDPQLRAVYVMVLHNLIIGA